MKRHEFRVFLGNPPWRTKDRLGVRAGSRWPFSMKKYNHDVPPYVPFPFFLAYATSVLEKNGFSAALVDAIALGIDEELFFSRIDDVDPQVIVIETSTPTFNQDVLLAEKIKSRFPESFLVFCGPHVSVMREGTLKDHPSVDAIMIGEYEYILLELCESLFEKTSLRKIKGLVFRGDDGEIVENERHPVITELDRLPWPAYHHLPMYNYNDDFQVLYKPNVQIWTSRGCPYKCIFCMWPQVMYGNHLYRTRSPEKVVDEIEWLVKTYGFKSFYIDDDTFNLGKARIMKFCEELKKRKLNVTWGAMARADTMDEEMLVAMADTGLTGIKYGIESAVQSIVTSSGKDLDLEKAKKTIEFTKRHGVKVHLTFTFGLPGETKESIDKTIAFALEQQTYSAQFSIVTPFPGTVYYEILKQKGYIISNNWDDFDGNTSAVIRTEHLSTADLMNALKKATDLYWKERQKWIQCP